MSNRRLPPSRKYEEEDFMKKLVAISVLFAGLATAVFAQDGGWSNAWKLGFTMKYSTDLFYTAHGAGKTEETQETTPGRDGSTASVDFANDGDNTWSKEYGKHSKGVTSFFPNGNPTEAGNAGNKIFVSVTNSGENYDISVNVGMSPWVDAFADKSTGPFKFLIGNMTEDWGVKLRGGIFDFGIGAWAADSISWIGYFGTWGGWQPQEQYFSRFGVWKTTGNASGSWVHSDHFRTLDEWGDPVYVGIKLGDQFKFTLGYSLGWAKFAAISSNDSSNQTDNRSAINGTFMFSGRPVDALTFELFYAIKGKDDDTFARPGTPAAPVTFGYKDPSGKWDNIIGAYFDVKAIDNLAIRAGYTARFNAVETGGFLCSDGDYTQVKPVTYNAPIFSGIDLKLKYTGIEKIGLHFQNNVSFAGVNGDKVEKDRSATGGLTGHERVYKDKINLLFGENYTDARTLGDGLTQNWFKWSSLLRADLGFLDGVDIEVSVAEFLGVLTQKWDTSVPTYSGADITQTARTDRSRTDTSNMLRATVGAKYGLGGGVTLGAALFLQIDSTLVDDVSTVTTTYAAGGNPRVVKTTDKSNYDTVKFGIPILFMLVF